MTGQYLDKADRKIGLTPFNHQMLGKSALLQMPLFRAPLETCFQLGQMLDSWWGMSGMKCKP